MKVDHYLIEVLLKTPAFVPEKWEVSIQNGDGRRPAAECRTLDDALIFLLSVTDPEALNKVYSVMSSDLYPMPLDRLCRDAGITLTDHQQIVDILQEKPELARYLRNLPGLDSIKDPSLIGRIHSERIEW